MYKIDQFLELKDSYVTEVFEYYEKAKELKKYIDIVTYIEKLVTDLSNFKEVFDNDYKRNNFIKSEELLNFLIEKYDIKKVGSCSACDEMQKELEELAYELLNNKMGENDKDYVLDEDEDEEDEDLFEKYYSTV